MKAFQRKTNTGKKRGMVNAAGETVKEGLQCVGDGLRIGVPIAIATVTVMAGIWGFRKITHTEGV